MLGLTGAAMSDLSGAAAHTAMKALDLDLDLNLDDTKSLLSEKHLSVSPECS